MLQDIRFISHRLKLKGRIATVCVSISFVIVILSLAISDGFRKELRANLSHFSGDVRITARNMDFVSDNSPIDCETDYVEIIRNLDCVKEIHKIIYRTGIVKHGGTIHGVLYKGVETQDSSTISIPQSLADMLNYKIGDQAVTYFVGDAIKVRRFRITEIYPDIVSENDYCVVYASIKDMRRLNLWRSHEVSAMEIILKPQYQSYAATKHSAALIATICSQEIVDEEDKVVVRSIIQEYPNIFDWLNLIDFNVVLVIVIMLIVAAFNMCSGLLIILFEHISMIGLLKSLGMSNKKIMMIFMFSSSRIILKGMLIGNALALSFCLVQYYTHFMPLDPVNYFVSFVPIAFPWLKFLCVNVGCYLTLLAVLLIPTLFISKVDPAKTMKIN